MRIAFSLCGDRSKASSRVRGFWIAEALQDLGFECRLRVTDSKFRLAACLFDILWADVVIFQKTYSRYHYGLMRLASFIGKKVYLDIDDLPSRSGSVQTLEYFSKMARLAQRVFVGSDELARDVSTEGGRPFLVPTGVKVSNYIQRSSGAGSLSEMPPCIGWIGNGRHYEDDLIDILLPVLRDLAKECRFSLKLVGVAGSERLREAGSAISGFQVELIDQLDWEDPGQIAQQLSSFDIGVYPLVDNSFNSRKCGFKALEYMASGIPVVASANGANATIVLDSETGYLASSHAQWLETLRRLVSDTALRQRLGEAGRVRAESQYDVAQISRKMSAVFKSTGDHA